MESRRIESLIAFEGFFYSFRAQPPFWLHGAFVVKTKGVNLLGNGGRRAVGPTYFNGCLGNGFNCVQTVYLCLRLLAGWAAAAASAGRVVAVLSKINKLNS